MSLSCHQHCSLSGGILKPMDFWNLIKNATRWPKFAPWPLAFSGVLGLRITNFIENCWNLKIFINPKTSFLLSVLTYCYTINVINHEGWHLKHTIFSFLVVWVLKIWIFDENHRMFMWFKRKCHLLGWLFWKFVSSGVKY